MKAVILAGGLGTRISEESHVKPKPMIEIDGKPILWHILKIYSEFGINDFVICCGYKGYIIKEYFQLTVYALLGMTVSQFLWLFGIKKIGLGLASIHMNATAFYVMIILTIFGGTWSNYQLFGAIIVGMGVYISQSSKKSFIN